MMNRSAFPHLPTRGYQRTPGFATDHPARRLAAYGRHGDTELAHVTPDEKAMLKARGGAGTTNPTTGLPEYYMGSDEMASRESGFGGVGDRFSTPVGQGGPGRSPTSVGIAGSKGQQTLGTHTAPGGGPSTTGFNAMGRMIGLNAQPSRGQTAQVNFNPIQAATMGLASPGFANISLGQGFQPGGGLNLGGSRTSPEDRANMGRALFNSVLGEPEAEKKSEPKEEERAPSFNPFKGNYLRYGQPGGVPSHKFFG
jgi:hypothetical protein